MTCRLRRINMSLNTKIGQINSLRLNCDPKLRNIIKTRYYCRKTTNMLNYNTRKYVPKCTDQIPPHLFFCSPEQNSRTKHATIITSNQQILGFKLPTVDCISKIDITLVYQLSTITLRVCVYCLLLFNQSHDMILLENTQSGY